MSEYIKCNKCGIDVKKKVKREYKILFFSKKEYLQSQDYWFEPGDLDIHLCNKCYNKMLKWLNNGEGGK